MPPTTGTKTVTDARTMARRTGTLLGGMPYLRFGTGTPLVVLPGFSQNNEPTVGFERMFVSQTLMPLAASHRILRLTPRPDLDPNATMADIARDHADALRLEFPGPVDVMGISTGGSIALQLAADHPDVVQRLIVVSAAYKLGPEGKRTQLRVAEEVAEGRPRRASREMFSGLATSALGRRLAAGVGWLLGPAMLGKATPDMLAIIHAEDGFNLRDRLSEIDAPTLVIGGDRDNVYPVELLRETATLIPNGRAIVYPGQGHMAVAGEPRLMQDVLEFLDGRSLNTPARGPRSDRPQEE